VKEVQDKVL